MAHTDGAASADAIAEQMAQVPQVKMLLAESQRYLTEPGTLAQFCIAMLGQLAACESFNMVEWQRAIRAGHNAVRIVAAEQRGATPAPGAGNASA
jgi:hypothetical protein